MEYYFETNNREGRLVTVVFDSYDDEPEIQWVYDTETDERIGYSERDAEHFYQSFDDYCQEQQDDFQVEQGLLNNRYNPFADISWAR